MIILRKPKSGSTIIILAEVPSGNMDGSNQIYTTAYRYKPGKISVFYNGQALHSPDDFEETGGYKKFELKHLFPDSTDELRVTYEVDGCYGGSPSACLNEDDHDELDHFFVDLVDTPATFSGHSGEYVMVNASETGVEFTSVSGIVDEQDGVEPIPNGASSLSVSLPQNFPDSDYTITLGLENIIDSMPSVYAMLISAKSNSGFDVIFSGDIDSNSYKLNWAVNR